MKLLRKQKFQQLPPEPAGNHLQGSRVKQRVYLSRKQGKKRGQVSGRGVVKFGLITLNRPDLG